jgi:Mg-chelatase subunit ChlD
MSTVTLALSGSNEVPPSVPLDLVMSIDCSNSMSGRMNETISATKNILTKLNPKNVKAGFVGWNESFKYSSNMTSNFRELAKRLDKIAPEGNTCLSVGLNASIDMLKNEKSSDMKAIILVSDGEENCNLDEKPCIDAKFAANLGIIVYTINVAPNNNYLLKCIADTTNGTYYELKEKDIQTLLGEVTNNVQNILAKDVVVSYAVPKDLEVSLQEGNITENNIKLLHFNIGTLSTNQKLDMNFNLFSEKPGSYVIGIEPESEITYTRYDGIKRSIPISSLTLNIKKEVQAENIGKSFLLNGQGSGGLARNKDTNVTVEKLIVPNANNTGPRIILRITAPWVTRADFVFAIDSSGSMFLDPQDANSTRKEVSKFIDQLNGISYPDGTKVDGRVSIMSWDNDVDFAYSPILNNNPNKAKMVPLGQALNDINTIFDKKYFKGFENETTQFDVGINNSIKILINNPPPSNYKNITKMFIIFVTDRSEFLDIDKNSSVLSQARKMNYVIYPIGLNVGPMMNDSLTRIAKQTNGYYGWSASTSQDIDRILEKNLKDITQKILYDTTVANDVMIVDSVYPYLTPDLTTLKGAKLLGFQSNPDGTKTLKLSIGNMSPGSVTEVSFDADINIDLPVDVTKDRSLFAYSVYNQTNKSEISYRWYNGENYTIDLPEGKMSIRNGQDGNEKVNIGIESGILAIFSLLVMYILRRSKHE